MLPGLGAFLPPSLLALEMGVESGDGAETKAESDESEAVEDPAAFSKLQASEQ